MGSNPGALRSVFKLGNVWGSQDKTNQSRPAALGGVIHKTGNPMKIRVVHENKAADLVVMDGETIGGLRRTLHGIFGIMMERLEIRKDDRLLTDSAATLVASGIGEGAVLSVTVSAPVVVKKKAPATPT